MRRHQCHWQDKEMYSKSHAALLLWASGFVSPLKTLWQGCPSLPLLLFSFPFLLTPLSAPFRSPRCFRPLWLWKPAVANYGETKGGTWTGSPGSTASQAGRQPLSVPVESSNSSLPPASCCEHRIRGGMSTQEDNAANVNSDLGSLLSACGFFFFLFSHSLSFLVSLPHVLCLKVSVCKQIPAHVICCLHHSSAFTAPSFLPPSQLACVPSFYPSGFSFHPLSPPPHPHLPMQLQAIIEVAAEQMADRQMRGKSAIWQLKDSLIN